MHACWFRHQICSREKKQVANCLSDFFSQMDHKQKRIIRTVDMLDFLSTSAPKAPNRPATEQCSQVYSVCEDQKAMPSQSMIPLPGKTPALQYVLSWFSDYSPLFVIFNKLKYFIGFWIQLLLLALERVQLPLQVIDVGLEEGGDASALLRLGALLLQQFPFGHQSLVLPLQALNLEGKTQEHLSHWEVLTAA